MNKVTVESNPGPSAQVASSLTTSTTEDRREHDERHALAYFRNYQSTNLTNLHTTQPQQFHQGTIIFYDDKTSEHSYGSKLSLGYRR